MRLLDYMRIALDQLRRRKVVTALCAMGISIGCSAIVVALSLGESAQVYAEKEMNSFFKVDEISVSPVRAINDENADPDVVNRGKLTKQKLDIIRSLPHVVAAAPFQELSYLFFQTSDEKRGGAQLIATELNSLPSFGYSFKQGSPSEVPLTAVSSYGTSFGLINDEDSLALQRKIDKEPFNEELWEQWRQMRALPSVLYQKQVALMNPEDMKPSTINLRIASVLSKGAGTTDDMAREDKRLYVSLETAETIMDQLNMAGRGVEFPEPGTFNSIKVKVDDQTNVEAVEKQIKKLMLDTSTNLHQKDRLQEQFAILRTVALGVGLFVLFIASISIVVAMVMSTHQRRRQIGIMKVLGSNLGQIRNMFIIEAALLGLLGGVIGVIFSYWIVWGINGAAAMVMEAEESIIFIPMYVIPLGIFFAILTGILSGIYPAIVASRTDALTAIKRD